MDFRKNSRTKAPKGYGKSKEAWDADGLDDEDENEGGQSLMDEAFKDSEDEFESVSCSNGVIRIFFKAKTELKLNCITTSMRAG
jgi:hypothetical protein